MDTNSRKSKYDGWVFSTSIPLEGKSVLIINTRKMTSGNIVSHAHVAIREGSMLQHRIHQDFSKVVGVSDKRATKKNVQELHDSLNLQSIVSQAVCFYVSN